MSIHKMQIKRKSDMHVCDEISFSLLKEGNVVHESTGDLGVRYAQ